MDALGIDRYGGLSAMAEGLTWHILAGERRLPHSKRAAASVRPHPRVKGAGSA